MRRDVDCDEQSHLCKWYLLSHVFHWLSTLQPSMVASVYQYMHSLDEKVKLILDKPMDEREIIP